MPYPYDKQLGVFNKHYHIGIVVDGIAFENKLDVWCYVYVSPQYAHCSAFLWEGRMGMEQT